jgi:hypothetical protein
MDLPKHAKGTDIELTIEVGHYTDVDKTVWDAEDLTGRKYYCWVYDVFKNIIAKFSKNDLSGRGFERTEDVDDEDGKFKIKIPYNITGASTTNTGEYYVSVQIQDEDEDTGNPYFTASVGQPYFELVENVGNVFTSDPPNS